MHRTLRHVVDDRPTVCFRDNSIFLDPLKISKLGLEAISLDSSVEECIIEIRIRL
jgi:hypothetical protein